MVILLVRFGRCVGNSNVHSYTFFSNRRPIAATVLVPLPVLPNHQGVVVPRATTMPSVKDASTVLTAGGPGRKLGKKGKKKKSKKTNTTEPKTGNGDDGVQVNTSLDQKEVDLLQLHENPVSFGEGRMLAHFPSQSHNKHGTTVPNADFQDRELEDADIHDVVSKVGETSAEDLYNNSKPLEQTSQICDDSSKSSDIFWLFFCFLGIMASFVVYGLLMEHSTSGGNELHELSFLFVTSALYTITAATGRHIRGEELTTIPPARFAVLGMTSMGSTFCSVRALRYVIYPIQVLAKSCKPVPVMIMGAFMGKKYSSKKYINVVFIVGGVALFMVGKTKPEPAEPADGKEEISTEASPSQGFGILLLFISLCFDGGTGAYEDKLMSVHSVQPFDLMYNIQLGKTILAGVGLLVTNQVHVFLKMCEDMGFLLVALGLSGALGQVFIFVTIAKFGALTCSIIGLARKVTTLVASILYFGHTLNSLQFTGLTVSVGAMILNFFGKRGKGGGGGHGGHEPPVSEEKEKMLPAEDDDGRAPSRPVMFMDEPSFVKKNGSQSSPDEEEGDLELQPLKPTTIGIPKSKTKKKKKKKKKESDSAMV